MFPRRRTENPVFLGLLYNRLASYLQTLVFQTALYRALSCPQNDRRAFERADSVLAEDR